MNNKTMGLIDTFERALSRLKEGVGKGFRSDLERDGVIQRFEYTFELAWKTLKAYMEDTGGSSPLFARDCFREAFRRGLIQEEEKWLELITLRNLTSHTYWEASAEEAMSHLPGVIVLFENLVNRLRKTT